MWILIIVISLGMTPDGGGVATIEFGTESACKNAAAQIKHGTYGAAYCFPKT